MRYSILLIAAVACTAPTEEAPVISLDVSKEHKAESIVGAQEFVDTIKGKEYKMQDKRQNGIPVSNMIWENGKPIVLTEYTVKDKKIVKTRSILYDSVGTPQFIVEQEVRQPGLLGRCLQSILPNQLLAQTQLTQCSAERYEVNNSARTLKMAISAALLTCGAAGLASTAPLCVLAVGYVAQATFDYNYRNRVYNTCMSKYTVPTGGTSGTSGTTTKTFPSDPNGNPASGGTTATCYTIRVYTLYGVLISESTVCE